MSSSSGCEGDADGLVMERWVSLSAVGRPEEVRLIGSSDCDTATGSCVADVESGGEASSMVQIAFLLPSQCSGMWLS